MRFILLLVPLLGSWLSASSATVPATPQTPAAEPKTGSLPPPPPAFLPSSPGDALRQILAMTAAEQEKLLAGKTPRQRQILEEKLRDYQPLSPAERESRLQTLQLRWHLLRLIKMPSPQRGEWLAGMTAADRELVEGRLKQWDQLPADLKADVLDNEMAISLFFPVERAAGRGHAPTRATPIGFPNLSAKQRDEIEKALARLNGLSEEKRQRIFDHFQQFFELNEKEKARTLNTLSPVERQQMEQTLQAFATLPKAQRDRCISGFQKFSELTPEEQQQFLRNAERWQNMSAKDRAVWRTLVTRLAPPQPPPQPPPLPPELNSPDVPPLPPTPSGQFTNQ